MCDAKIVYRSRSRESLNDDTLKFLSSMDDDHYLLNYDIAGSQAHSMMLHETGNITLEELKKILNALDEAKKNRSKLLAMDGYEDIHEALEDFVIKNAGMEAGGKMHTARSRNDQVALDIRMKIRDDINDICSSIADLIGTLVQKAKANKDAPMPMYTHLQQAQIGTFSHFLLSYADALFRDLERLYVAFGRINQSPLGACAIGGTSINIDRKKTAVLLGFDDLVKNSIDATSSRDSFLEYASSLSILATSLSRISEDLIIWSTSEFGFIELSDAFSSTSSAMPQKKNPDPLELTRAKCALVIGNLVSMMVTVKGLPSGYSRDLQDLKPPLFGASSTALETTRIIRGVIETLVVNKKRMKQASDASYAISLDIAEQLVVKKKVPFRMAHKVVGLLVQKASEKNNLALSKLSFRDVASALKKINNIDLDPKYVMKTIKEMTPERSLLVRNSLGSPNMTQQEQMIEYSLRKLAGYKEGIEKRTKFVKGSFDNLDKSVSKYLEA